MCTTMIFDIDLVRKFKIFLPLRFYVKSILAILDLQKQQMQNLFKRLPGRSQFDHEKLIKKFINFYTVLSFSYQEHKSFVWRCTHVD